MRLYRALVFVVLWIYTCASLAQTMETTQSFDTSNNQGAASEEPIEETTNPQITPEYEEGEPKGSYEDPNNPGVFISQGKKVESGNSSPPGEITFGEIRSESKLQNSAIKSSKPLYTVRDLDQDALRIAAHCKPSDTSGRRGMAVVTIGEEFYVLPTKPAGLPPKPGSDADTTVMGIDVNQNCVRDDVEHFIFDTWNKSDQDVLRLHLYAYAIWLRFYLVQNISKKSIQAVERQLLITGLCMDKLLGPTEYKQAEIEIFALMHNTDERTMRFFENEDLLTGFDIDTDVQPGC